jgi:hypothetical protein
MVGLGEHVLGGLIARTVCAPLDRATILAQTTRRRRSRKADDAEGEEEAQDEEEEEETAPLSLWEALTASNRFAGHGFAVLRVLPRAIILNVLPNALDSALPPRYSSPALRSELTSAATVVLLFPLDILRTLGAVGDSRSAGQVTHEEGRLRLTAGLAATLVASAVQRATFRFSYNVVRSRATLDSTGKVLALGLTCTALSRVISHPFDTFRRQQMLTGDSSPRNAATQLRSRWFGGLVTAVISSSVGFLCTFSIHQILS